MSETAAVTRTVLFLFVDMYSDSNFLLVIMLLVQLYYDVRFRTLTHVTFFQKPNIGITFFFLFQK